MTIRALIFLTVVAAAFAQHNCGKNAHFDPCGTGCPLTCENYDNPPKECFFHCDMGCQCETGYVKASYGRCVRPEHCFTEPQDVCGVNEIFLECASAITHTCDDFKNSPEIYQEECVKNSPEIYQEECVSACECHMGYVRNKDGRCVSVNDCFAEPRPVCRLNQTYGHCSYTMTCDNLHDPSKIFPAKCDYGCVCAMGYVEIEEGRCVRQEDCPRRAPPSDAPSACLEEKVVGRCRGHFIRYYYNSETGQCEEFAYGGCDGNSNNFLSKQDCEAVCNA